MIFETWDGNKKLEISINNICAFKVDMISTMFNECKEVIVLRYNSSETVVKKDRNYEELISDEMFTKIKTHNDIWYVNKDRLLAKHIYEDKIVLEFPYDIYV